MLNPGHRVGRLEILEYDARFERRTDKGGHQGAYLCVCDCGELKWIKACNLSPTSQRKKTRSCGCLQKEELSERQREKHKHKTPDQMAANTLWTGYRLQARRRGLVFEISFDEFVRLIKKNCHYCNQVPCNYDGTHFRKKYDQPEYRIFYSGLDRINSDLGYISENVVPCCKKCNVAKNWYSEFEFLSWVKSIYEHKKLQSLSV